MYERNRLLYAGDACQGSAVLPFGQPRTSLGNAETGTFFVARLSGQPVSVSMPPRGHEATALVDGADWQRPWKSRGLRFGLRRSWKPRGRIGSRRCRMQRWRQKFCVVSHFGKIWCCLRMQRKRRDNGAVDAKTVSVPCLVSGRRTFYDWCQRI